MRAALEVNELVNGRSEECEPEDSVKEVDIDFTMQENHYILDLPPHLPDGDPPFEPMVVPTATRRFAALAKGEQIGARSLQTRPQVLSRLSWEERCIWVDKAWAENLRGWPLLG
jgi:hypothetical protein